MSHTIFIYASIVLVVLIILGVVFTIITMRRLHSTQKQLQKQDKASTKEKNTTGMGTNHFIFIQELPPEQNIETQGAFDYSRLKPV